MNNEPIKGCQGPCGSIDCSHGCIDKKPWTGSKADSNEMIDWIAKNTARDTPQQPQPMAAYVQGQEYTGGSVSYYQVKVTSPTSGADAYTAECNDIIEALGMNYAEGNAFKAIWRRCAARNLGLSKRGYTDGLYDAEKVVFFGQRMVAQEKSK
ncbi:MAG TPA: hypothetical protein VFM48_08600 [Aquabacterium sp.]|nr:hypothetical protein [Aquabacterium sp.]